MIWQKKNALAKQMQTLVALVYQCIVTNAINQIKANLFKVGSAQIVADR
jgi:hypothetical protein